MNTSLKDLITQSVVVAPGTHDGFSALLGQRSTFPALYVSGYCVAASRFGLPDAGLIGLAEMLEAIRLVGRCSSKPIIADADTGYGGLLNVQHTVREYEAAGASAIQLEDQEMPKKCGHTKGKRVVALDDMVAKVAVAVQARRSDNFLVIARTDTLATHGFEEALRRCSAYREAGADVVFVDAMETEAQMRQLGAMFPKACMVNVTPAKHFMTPQISTKQLNEMGFAIAIFPGLLAVPAMAAMERSLQYLADNGISDPNAMPATSPHELVGFPAVWADEERWQQRFGG
ncbi:MAG: isocitrate lyase/PEP mutase family protein [Burkholderiaceae bacterium]|nr:isocitrate lyase/PEP mutase family protein [Burkholderiaceae bacterium]